MTPGLPAHDTLAPDVETAGEGYRRRFEGPVGEWFLETQRRAVLGLLARHAGGTSLSVLELGGGHGQLAGALAGAGHRVVVHGSRPGCHDRLREGGAGLIVSDLWRLPFGDRSFDLLLAVRLLGHVEKWRELLVEMARVSRRYVLFDYPPSAGFNIIAPALFGLKRRVEGNTRPWFRYRTGDLRAALASLGLDVLEVEKQFALPMGLHRALRAAPLSRRVEALCRAGGLTGLIGSPGLILSRRAR